MNRTAARQHSSRLGKASSPAWYRAARTVLRSSMAIVIGPTPPGTGVRSARDLGRAGVDVADEPAVGRG